MTRDIDKQTKTFHKRQTLEQFTIEHPNRQNDTWTFHNNLR